MYGNLLYEPYFRLRHVPRAGIFHLCIKANRSSAIQGLIVVAIDERETLKLRAPNTSIMKARERRTPAPLEALESKRPKCDARQCCRIKHLS